jgi:hypothetical protein
VKLRRKKNNFVKYTNLKKLRRKNKKREEDIPEHEGEVKELRREEKKKKGDKSVVKLGIVSFLLGRFTDGFTYG